MDTFFSYSLEDFLLFSRETWSVLFSEYAQSVFFFPVIVILLYGLSLISGYIKPALSKPLNLVTQLTLLLSCYCYYWLFYREINPFSEILAAICLFLVVAVTGKMVWLTRKRQAQIFSEQGRVGSFQKSIWLLLIPGICLLFFSEYGYSETGDWLLPGWYAGTSLLMLVNLQLLNNERWWLFFPAQLIITETITLYLIGVNLWWLPLLLLIASLGALVLDYRKEIKQQIQDDF